VILIDSSAWIEFLRKTGSPVNRRVRELLEQDVATCGAVRMEILAGARSERHLSQLRGLLARATLMTTTPAHYEVAAACYRACRSGGETVRKLIDCLIAAHAISAGAELLQMDADFEVLARHTPLRLAPLTT
jgi:predicted nucleic acid-binding protein